MTNVVIDYICSRIQQAFYQINQKEKAITDLEKMNRHQKDTIIAKEEVITVLRKEKDDLQTRFALFVLYDCK